jgi:hypothetical protein
LQSALQKISSTWRQVRQNPSSYVQRFKDLNPKVPDVPEWGRKQTRARNSNLQMHANNQLFLQFGIARVQKISALRVCGRWRVMSCANRQPINKPLIGALSDYSRLIGVEHLGKIPRISTDLDQVFTIKPF